MGMSFGQKEAHIAAKTVIEADQPAFATISVSCGFAALT